MKLTIDNLNGAGETDYTALLDAGAPPKIVRKLNQPPVCTAWLACQGTGIAATAGSKLRLYRDTGALWFSGYLVDAPQQSYAGIAMGVPVFRVELSAKGEISRAGPPCAERTRGDGRMHGGPSGDGADGRGERGVQHLGCADNRRGRKRNGGER